MKLKTNIEEFDAFPVLNKYFLILWLKGKRYPMTKELTYSQWTELALALDMQSDVSVRSGENQSGMFNNVLDLGEFLLAFDGSEPIEILSAKVNEKIKRKINQYLIVKS